MMWKVLLLCESVALSVVFLVDLLMFVMLMFVVC